jgi:ribonuclease Z
MTIEVHILGTSSARPTSIRQVSGSLISCRDGIAVVDAGEGFQSRFATQRKRMKSFETYHLKSSKVGVLCLTHGHLDHTWGVLPWLQSMALDNRNQSLLVIGPTTDGVIDAMLSGQPIPEDTPQSDLSVQYRFWHQLGGISSNLGYEVRWVLGAVKSNRWIEFSSQGKVVELSEMPQPEGWRHNRIEAIPTVHTIPSCAWQLNSKVRKGKFNRYRAIELGLSEDEKAELAAGTDVDKNGELLLSKDFRGEDFRPLSVIISGDTAEMAPSLISVNGCNLLIHEATFLDDLAQHAQDYLHSTASGAARTAIACGAKHLVLTHYGARIKQTGPSLDEAMSELANSEISLSAAWDGDRVLVEDSGEVSHLYWRDDGWTR